MGLTDSWELGKIITGNWEILVSLTDSWERLKYLLAEMV